jgi:hypothetical protein
MSSLFMRSPRNSDLFFIRDFALSWAGLCIAAGVGAAAATPSLGGSWLLVFGRGLVVLALASMGMESLFMSRYWTHWRRTGNSL